MAVQVFRTDQQLFEVAALMVDQMAWFKGKEVAICLGYSDAPQALRKNVDEEDKMTYEELTQGVVCETSPSNQQPHEVYINESGLYSLVLRSKKEEAKAFKRWVTSEVLPSIRRNGGYGAATLAVPPELTTAITELRQAVQDLKESVKNNSGGGVQHTVLCLSSPQPNGQEQRMLRVGKVLSAAEVEDFNATENVVQLSTWLESRVRATNPEAKRKILDAFRKGAKEARLQQAEADGNLVPMTWNQGGHRILYTAHDEDLLLEVLGSLQQKFENMIRWYNKMVNPAVKKKQTRMDAFMKRPCSLPGSSTD